MSAHLRAAAARTVAEVLAGRSLDEALATHKAAFVDLRHQALLQAIAYGVLRERRVLEQLARRMLQSPVSEPLAQALILVGLYQLRALRVSTHAAVSETVEATGPLGLSRLRGLVNALLRRYLREREALESALPRSPAERYSYPDWLVRRLRQDWPQDWESVLAAGNVQAPMSLRVNARRCDRDSYAQRLQRQGGASRLLPYAPQGLVLEQAVDVQALPGFAEGEVSVQDASAQLAAGLLAPEAGQRVLDACAAPGGKSAHLLETCDLELLALDRDATRLERVQSTLDRLGLRAALRVADAAQPRDWWDGRPFERILIDAPCSGTGVIRRHPDIKWLRRESDIPALATQQLQLLTALWPLLAPGGRLVYAVCSLLSAEGEDVCRRFLTQTPDAKPQAIDAPWGEAQRLGRRIAPGGDHDGFFYAVFVKPPRRTA